MKLGYFEYCLRHYLIEFDIATWITFSTNSFSLSVNQRSSIDILIPDANTAVSEK